MAGNINYRLDHFGIRVNNLEISTNFYKKNFGFQKIRESDKPNLQLKLATLQLEDSYLELLQPYTTNQTKTESPQTRKESLSKILERTSSHIAISVDNLADMHTQLTKNNVELAAPFNFPESRNIFCYDPDGFLIEIKQR